MAHGRRRRRVLRRRGGPGGPRGAGQSTLEYLLMLVAFIAMIGALALVWHAARDGRLLDLASGAASHGAGGSGVAMLKDVLQF